MYLNTMYFNTSQLWPWGINSRINKYTLVSLLKPTNLNGRCLILTPPRNVLQPMKLFLGNSRPMKNLLTLRFPKSEQTPNLDERLSDSRLKATAPSLPLTLILLKFPSIAPRVS